MGPHDDALTRAALRVLPEDRALALRLLDDLPARRDAALAEAGTSQERGAFPTDRAKRVRCVRSFLSPSRAP